MSRKTSYNVSVSSLFDLKAELYKKQGESQKKNVNARGAQDAFYVTNKAVDELLRKPKKSVTTKVQGPKVRDLSSEEAREEERLLRNSKQRLEEKAKLYDRLSTGQVRQDDDVEEDEQYLVNFDTKLTEAAEASGKAIGEDDSDNDEEQEPGPPVPDAASPDDEWVEYVDSLGRTRRCMRKDLSSFVSADKRLQQEATSSSSEPPTGERELLSADMRREQERRAWEAEADQPKGPTHYQHVLRDEAWNHGVAYFRFSTDEDVRKQQMQALDEMRQKTIEQRTKNERIQEKRKALMEARLAKVRERKKIKLADDDDDEVVGPSVEQIPLPAAEEIAAAAAEKQAKAFADLLAERRRATHVRPWDKEKNKFSHDQYVEKRRAERDEEFAPPKLY